MSEYDAVVVGSGPNGLAAAIVMAQAGRSVLVLEAEHQMGGGARTMELTLPGFRHDICSAAHPLGFASPFFRRLPLAEHGLEWIHPPFSLAHPLDTGEAGVLDRSVDATADRLGKDGRAYKRLMTDFAAHWEDVLEDALAPPIHVPKHPLLMARLGWYAARSAAGLAKSLFRTDRGQALLAGIAAHAGTPLTNPISGAFGLMLGVTGNATGWPIAKGGSQSISDALASYLRSLGGKIQTDTRVASLDELPASQTVFLDVTPRQALTIVGDKMPLEFRQQWGRYRYGPASFKIDWALSGSIPWKAPECMQAGTVHLGGTLEELIASENMPINGEIPDRPFVLVVQQSSFDPTRAPEGKHTGWAWCHVPLGCKEDMTGRIEAQVERFAPGFRDLILARASIKASEMSAHNANLVEGDIGGGTVDIRQLFLRPTPGINPYATPMKGVYLCSSSTPPGPGVHGMCGYNAAQSALHDGF